MNEKKKNQNEKKEKRANPLLAEVERLVKRVFVEKEEFPNT